MAKKIVKTQKTKTAPKTNGIEVTSVKVGETKVTPAGHSAIKASLSEIQLKIMTVLYKLDAAVPADEIHTLDSSVSVAQIKHHCYKDERLCRLGLVVCVKSEGTRTLSYRLTGAGMAVVRAR